MELTRFPSPAPLKMTDRLQIDIGIGDIVDEYEIGLHQLEYKNAPLIGETGVRC